MKFNELATNLPIPSGAIDDSDRGTIGGYEHVPGGAYTYAVGEEMWSLGYSPVDSGDGFYRLFVCGGGSFYVAAAGQRSPYVQFYGATGASLGTSTLSRRYMNLVSSHQTWYVPGMIFKLPWSGPGDHAIRLRIGGGPVTVDGNDRHWVRIMQIG